jgi:hypothetical protein
MGLLWVSGGGAGFCSLDSRKVRLCIPGKRMDSAVDARKGRVAGSMRSGPFSARLTWRRTRIVSLSVSLVARSANSWSFVPSPWQGTQPNLLLWSRWGRRGTRGRNARGRTGYLRLKAPRSLEKMGTPEP